MKNNAVHNLRYGLIEEELLELAEALWPPGGSYPDYKPDRVGVADALGDLLYVVYGAAEVYGIDIDRVFREIHRSNMTKVSVPGANERIHKIQKGPNYSPPDLSFVMDNHESI